MKKRLACALLACTFLLSSTGCTQSEEDKKVDDIISNITNNGDIASPGIDMITDVLGKKDVSDAELLDMIEDSVEPINLHLYEAYLDELRSYCAAKDIQLHDSSYASLYFRSVPEQDIDPFTTPFDESASTESIRESMKYFPPRYLFYTEIEDEQAFRVSQFLGSKAYAVLRLYDNLYEWGQDKLAYISEVMGQEYEVYGLADIDDNIIPDMLDSGNFTPSASDIQLWDDFYAKYDEISAIVESRMVDIAGSKGYSKEVIDSRIRWDFLVNGVVNSLYIKEHDYSDDSARKEILINVEGGLNAYISEVIDFVMSDEFLTELWDEYESPNKDFDPQTAVEAIGYIWKEEFFINDSDVQYLADAIIELRDAFERKGISLRGCRKLSDSSATYADKDMVIFEIPGSFPGKLHDYISTVGGSKVLAQVPVYSDVDECDYAANIPMPIEKWIEANKRYDIVGDRFLRNAHNVYFTSDINTDLFDTYLRYCMIFGLTYEMLTGEQSPVSIEELHAYGIRYGRPCGALLALREDFESLYHAASNYHYNDSSAIMFDDEMFAAYYTDDMTAFLAENN